MLNAFNGVFNVELASVLIVDQHLVMNIIILACVIMHFLLYINQYLFMEGCIIILLYKLVFLSVSVFQFHSVWDKYYKLTSCLLVFIYKPDNCRSSKCSPLYCNQIKPRGA